MSDTRTITLTGRPPVRITEADWPQIAIGSEYAHDGDLECQANRRTKIWIRVRRHADGRSLIYGRYEHDSAWQSEPDAHERAGRLCPPSADIPATIAEVADLLVAQGAPPDMTGRVARECVADLPAETI